MISWQQQLCCHLYIQSLIQTANKIYFLIVLYHRFKAKSGCHKMYTHSTLQLVNYNFHKHTCKHANYALLLDYISLFTLGRFVEHKWSISRHTSDISFPIVITLIDSKVWQLSHLAIRNLHLCPPALLCCTSGYSMGCQKWAALKIFNAVMMVPNLATSVWWQVSGKLLAATAPGCCSPRNCSIT